MWKTDTQFGSPKINYLSIVISFRDISIIRNSLPWTSHKSTNIFTISDVVSTAKIHVVSEKNAQVNIRLVIKDGINQQTFATTTVAK